MKNAKFALKTIKIFMKNQMQNKTYVILDVINMIARCLVVFLLYGYVFEINSGNIKGASYIETLWSMFIYFCIMTLNVRKIHKLIMDDVRSGNVEMFLINPVNYVVLTFYKIIGQGVYSFGLISILGGIAMAIFVGIPNVDWMVFIPTFIITLILGVILALFMYSIIGLLAFYMQDIRPVYWITDKLVMILGGSYLPVAFFPPLMKFFALISPFGAVNFASSTVYASWGDEFLVRILIQIGWIAIFGALLVFIYKCVRKKAMINGG